MGSPQHQGTGTSASAPTLARSITSASKNRHLPLRVERHNLSTSARLFSLPIDSRLRCDGDGRR
jgi:hypothetical protein